MSAATGEVVELLTTMIRNGCVNTGDVASGQEVRTADTLRAFLGDAVDTAVVDAAPGRRSVVARLRGSDPTAPSLGLVCHTDVVPATDADWTRDPFAGEVDQGIVWGRGAIDMLDTTATMAVAMRRAGFAARRGIRPRGDIVFVAAADEEGHADHGTRYLLDHHRDEVMADRIVTEGGGWPLTTGPVPALSWAVAEKGSAWLRLDVHGRAGHAAMPHGADNALVTAAEVVRRLAEHRVAPSIPAEWEAWVAAMGLDADLAAGLLDPATVLATAEATGDPALAAHAHACTHLTITPTGARGGVVINAIPDLVEIDVDARILPGQTCAQVEAEIARALGPLTDRVDVVWRHRLETTTSPVASPLRDTIAGIADALVPGTRLVPGMITASTDADYFRRAGAEVYGFSMHSGHATPEQFRRMFHGPDERVDLRSLELSTAMWTELISQS
ncbi:M20/M25/M40 family metallo-hydrolase [Actinomycetospora endophytica]|uniref:M20/M25/M40 family metallo-hydrolase n=1 Tax=Actinomycetospora endophytica TaxID=2291215 RepID=A0ABS8PG94_9PSEU|nr:M20/M25/M40 family metallo-hydrolase [Actinomycetospora endophytica]MCD2197295.1 M20/M25/M40 family metallo-hydrolase [Actinomycetospora endophytica]